jgi:hypothetical protein
MTLVGTEILYVQGIAQNGSPSGQEFPCTTLQIAALADAANVPPAINTAISTVGAGTLTAAALVGGVITRTGPTAVFSDTVATAVQIVAALDAYVAAESQYVYIRNTTAFTQTIVTASGVTLSGDVVIPAFSTGVFLMTIDSPTAVTILRVSTMIQANTNPEVITTLSTVGAGTITAAGIVGGVTSRTGSQSATPFTDTTDTAANIIAALPGAAVGMSFEYTYTNTTNATATLAGGTGVTVSGVTSVTAGKSVRYLVTYTAAATLTMVAISVGSALSSSQSASFAGSTSGTTTLVASAIAGTTTQTLPAVTGTVASTTGSNLFVADVTRCTSALTKNGSAAYSNITGLSQTVVPGTYRFRAVLPSTVASGTGGIKYAFNYTTAVLSGIEATGLGYTASAVAVQHTTTTTTQTDLFTQAAVVIMTVLEGTMVVTTGGTVDLQMAQNTSNGSNTVTLVGSTMEFVRIA